jgi:hypothetical protein
MWRAAGDLSIGRRPAALDWERPSQLRAGSEIRSASQARSVLLDAEKAEEGAWFRMTTADESSSIFITRYEVHMSPDDVPSAYRAYVHRYPSPGYTDLEQLEIDGRPAWGFSETQWLDGEICAVSYRAIIPYESETFAVEFFSDIPQWLDAARQREVVSEFEVPES